MKPVDAEQLTRDIFGLGCEPYPATPGAKEKGGASQDAANAIAPLAADLRGKFAKYFFETHPAGHTADEVAERFRVSPFSARPRITELNQAGLIVRTGERRRNRSTMTASVWTASALLLGTSATDDGVNPSLIPGPGIDGGAP